MVSEQSLDAIMEHIKNLERRVAQLENNAAPTIPIYDQLNWPEDAVEGQVVIAPII